MPVVTSHRAVCLAVAVVVALLLGGCADQAADSPAGAASATTASVIPTTTTIPLLTTEELAWLDVLTKMKETFERNATRCSGQEQLGCRGHWRPCSARPSAPAVGT
jgi:hypothetical protein